MVLCSTGFDSNGFGIELYNKVTNSWKHHHNTTASLLSVDKFRSFWVVIADGKIEYDKKLLKDLAAKGYDPLYGARPLKRAIQQHIENTLAQSLLSGEIKPKDKVTMVYSSINANLVKMN